MPSPLRTELTLPNDPRILGLARTYLQELSALAELEPEDAGRIIRAAEEACANVIDHAFEPGESGTFRLAGEVTPTELIVSVHDQGLPFDPEREPERLASQDSSPSRLSASGGLRLIREAVDSAQWVNHGDAGKELRLVKRRPQSDVRRGEPAPEPAEAFKAPLAPQQEYTIRLFQPDDAAGIARCIYRVYGYTYIHPDCYYPDRIVKMNETGEMVSIVAAAENGEIVGHYALERLPGSRVAERGVAVVDPAHRGRDLMTRMRVCLEEEARRQGLTGVFSTAVTQHVYSQKVNEEFGSAVCGIQLGAGPRNQVFKKMHDEPLPQRGSYVIYYSHVQPLEPGRRFAPSHHRAVLQQIYERLGVPVDWHEGESPQGRGAVRVSYDPAMDIGKIQVREIGIETAAEVRRAADDLLNVTGAEAVYLEIPLSQPGAPTLCEAAEQAGFFFSGVGPAFAGDGDALLLQRLALPLDPALLQVANAFARELVDYAARERERVGG